MTTEMLTPDQATNLAARILAAIKRERAVWGGPAGMIMVQRCDADLERVASDLAGLIECHFPNGGRDPLVPGMGNHAARFSANLIRTANLYGVTP